MARYVKVSAISPAWWQSDDAVTCEEQVQAMMRRWEKAIAPVLPDRPDIIVLPEACDRFADRTPEQNRAYYDVRGERIRDFFAQMARKNGCYIAYSAIRRAEDGFFRNSTQIIGRDGRVAGIYDKNHLVVTEGALDGPIPMMCGKDAPVFAIDIGRVACAICFDLNFDELRRRYGKAKPELLLFSSNYHGGFMQQAWAYDCRSYLIGAVRNQDCRVVSPVGEVIASSTNYFPYLTANVNLDYAVCHLDFNWDKFIAAKKKYGPRIGFHDPGNIGAALLTSECDEFTVGDIVREFDIELLDDYFERSRRSQDGRRED